MRFRFVVFFILFTLLFLFYPGNSLYLHIFAFNRDLFTQEKPYKLPVIQPIPYVSSFTQPVTSAEGIYIIDLSSLTPIYEKNAHMSLFPASTTKIITALVTVDLYKPDDVITVQKVRDVGQVMGLVRGERITVQNILYGMLIHSGNDAAFAVADYYGYDKFINLMNKKAKELGMKDSHFENPAGLDDPRQYSTAYDLTLASRELLANKMLKTTVGIKEIIIADVEFKYFHQLSNVNKLLGEIQGVGGLKTGYTENAGENLVSFYTYNGHQFIIAILKSADRFEDTKNIINWINENVSFIDPQ